MCGDVIEVPVCAGAGVGDRIEHPRIDTGIVNVDRVLVVDSRAVGDVVGQMETGRTTVSGVRNLTIPTFSVDDNVTRLRICTNAYINADDSRRLDALELDVYWSIVL